MNSQLPNKLITQLPFKLMQKDQNEHGIDLQIIRMSRFDGFASI